MPLFARRNIRVIGSDSFVYPVLQVERIDLVPAKRGTFKGEKNEELELFVLENGQRFSADTLLFLEPVDEDLLIAMRLEARILADRDRDREGR